MAGLLDGVFAKHIQNPKKLLAEGEIEEALLLMLEYKDSSLLLGQYKDANHQFLLNLIDANEFNRMKNRIIAAALDLLK